MIRLVFSWKTCFCCLGQINPHLFQVSLNLVSVYHHACAHCFITKLEVFEGKLSMKRLKRSRGWKRIENKEINLTSPTAISSLHSTPQSGLTLSNFSHSSVKLNTSASFLHRYGEAPSGLVPCGFEGVCMKQDKIQHVHVYKCWFVQKSSNMFGFYFVITVLIHHFELSNSLESKLGTEGMQVTERWGLVLLVGLNEVLFYLKVSCALVPIKSLFL